MPEPEADDLRGARLDEAAALSRACRLARRGQGDVEPNPPVGAVVLAGGRVVGEGWHRAWGGAHAEVEALAAAGPSAQGATLVVSLEPCCTTGKTPPCTAALRQAGVSRVVVGAVDPHPSHGGAGLAVLQRAGIEVLVAGTEAFAAAHGEERSVGAAREAQALLARFRAALTARRPFVLAKWAQSLEGAVAGPGGERRALSSSPSLALLHRWRSHLDGILVGVGTVLGDDPLLTARSGDGPRRPLRRIVLDPALRTPVAARLVTTADTTATWIVTTDEADEERAERLRAHGVEVRRVPAGPSWLADVLASLRLAGVARLMVEGGPTTLERLLEARLVDAVALFLTPVSLGPQALPALPGWALRRRTPQELAAELELAEVEVIPVGGDLLLRGFRAARP